MYLRIQEPLILRWNLPYIEIFMSSSSLNSTLLPGSEVDDWAPLTWQQYDSEVVAVAKALMALDVEQYGQTSLWTAVAWSLV